METVGHCPSKKLLRGPAFFPDVRQLVQLQYTGQSERSFLKKETRVAQPWWHHHPWHCDTPRSPDDQTVVQAVWMGSVLEFITQTTPGTFGLQFFRPFKKPFAEGLVSWLHALDTWHKFHCEVRQCPTGVNASVEVVVMLKSGVQLCVCVKVKGKVKFTLVQALEAQTGSTRRALIFP